MDMDMKPMDLFRVALVVTVSGSFLLSNVFAKITETEQDRKNYGELHSHRQIGEISVDLALGAAALKLGKYDEALFTYDRVLINEPQNHTALLGKLDTLIKLRQFNTAKLISQRIKRMSLTSDERKHLDQLELSLSFSSKFRHQLRGSLIFGLDNNASIASSDSSDDYQRFLGAIFGLDVNQIPEYVVDYYTKNNEKCASPYLRPILGYNGSYQFHPLFSLFWDFNLDHTRFLRYSHFDVTHDYYNIGFNLRLGRFFLQESFYSQNYLFDGRRYRDTFLGLFSAGYLINNNNLLRIYGEGGQLIYPHYRRSNVYTYTAGIGWLYSLERYALNLRWYYNRHQAKNYDDELKNYAARHAYGTYLATKFKLTNKWSIGSEFLHQYANYDSYRPLYQKRRRDNFFDINTSIRYQLNRYCDLYIKLDYARNNSNFTGYSYRHFVSSTGINFKI